MQAIDKVSLTRRSIAGFLQLGCSHVLLVGIRIAAIAVLARLLSPQDFGTTQAAMIVIALAEVLAHLGLGPALVQAPSLRGDQVVSAFFFALFSGCLIGLGVGLGARPMAAVFNMPLLENVLVWLSFTIPANALAAIASALLQRDLKYRHIAWVEVGSYTVGFGVVGITLASFHWGCWALVFAAITHFFVRSAGFCALVVPTLEGRPSWKAFSQLLPFGAGFSLAVVLNQLALRGDQFIIGRCLGNHTLGIYSRAYGVLNSSVSALGRVLDLVVFSSMSRKQTDLRALSRAYQRTLAAVALLVMPASALAVVLGPEIIHLLLGPAWNSAVVPLQILAAGVYFRVAYKISGTLARSLGRVHTIAWRQGVYLLLVLAGAWLGHFFGLEGASAGIVLALIAHYVSMSSMAIRLLPDLDWLRIGIATLPGIGFATGATIVAFAVAEGARFCQCPEIVVCLATCLAVAFFVGTVVHLFPQCLGYHGNWMMDRVVREHFPGWLQWIQPLPRDTRVPESS